jgi:hypothetical protein
VDKVHIQRRQRDEARHQQREQPSRERVLEPASHDHADVEQPVPQDRVGERRRQRQEQQRAGHHRQAAHHGRLSRPRRGPVMDEHPEAGEAGDERARQHHAQPAALGNVVQPR